MCLLRCSWSIILTVASMKGVCLRRKKSNCSVGVACCLWEFRQPSQNRGCGPVHNGRTMLALVSWAAPCMRPSTEGRNTLRGRSVLLLTLQSCHSRPVAGVVIELYAIRMSLLEAHWLVQVVDDFLPTIRPTPNLSYLMFSVALQGSAAKVLLQEHCSQ